MISLGRHLSSLLLGLATTALLVSGLAVALPAAGWPAELANTLGWAVRSAAVVDPGPRVTDRDTVAAPVTSLRTVPRALVAAVPAATSPASASPTPRVKPVSRTTTKSASRSPAAAVIAATNAERAEAGCGPLRADAELTAAAQEHAEDMAAKDYFSHTDRDGSDSADRIRAAGFAGSATGENIAYGQESASEVVAAWMDSSGHRQNILDCDYNRIGVGYDSHGDYWVQTFGG